MKCEPSPPPLTLKFRETCYFGIPKSWINSVWYSSINKFPNMNFPVLLRIYFLKSWNKFKNKTWLYFFIKCIFEFDILKWNHWYSIWSCSPFVLTLIYDKLRNSSLWNCQETPNGRFNDNICLRRLRDTHKLAINLIQPFLHDNVSREFMRQIPGRTDRTTFYAIDRYWALNDTRRCEENAWN